MFNGMRYKRRISTRTQTVDLHARHGISALEKF